MIIDLRYYPSQDFNEFVSQYIVPDSVKYTVRFTYPDLALPGVFYARDYSYPTYKTEKYNAPIIIMVNEGTQSYGETSVQKIQNNPYTITIGSQSAGADGNISKFTLPRGVLGAFSGLGWYYPDGWVVNRHAVNAKKHPTIIITARIVQIVFFIKSSKIAKLQSAAANCNFIFIIIS